MPIFFLQAEDGIRDVAVTGVQTCALPISGGTRGGRDPRTAAPARAPRSPRGRVSPSPLPERGGASERASPEATPSPPPDPAHAADRAHRARGGAAARPGSDRRGHGPRAHGARGDPR